MSVVRGTSLSGYQQLVAELGADAAQLVIASGRHGKVQFGGEAVLGTAYAFIGQPERGVEWRRARLARGRDNHGTTGQP